MNLAVIRKFEESAPITNLVTVTFYMGNNAPVFIEQRYRWRANLLDSVAMLIHCFNNSSVNNVESGGLVIMALARFFLPVYLLHNHRSYLCRL